MKDLGNIGRGDRGRCWEHRQVVSRGWKMLELQEELCSASDRGWPVMFFTTLFNTALHPEYYTIAMRFGCAIFRHIALMYMELFCV